MNNEQLTIKAKKNMKKVFSNIKTSIILLFSYSVIFSSCSNWLDVIPDGIATVDMAFNSRTQAIKYLATCYSYMPKNGNIFQDYPDPAMMGSDEFRGNPEATDNSATGNQSLYMTNGIKLSMGNQSAVAPLFGYWNRYYQALRHCNEFIANVGRTPDMPAWERNQWIAEVKTLKAYYHFILVQMYGPVPLIRENLPVDAGVSTVKVVREPVDDCFAYIVDLLDEAIDGDALPMAVLNETAELGRITKPIALAIKAKVLVTAASPLFNGNDQQATLKNHDGTPLFNATYDGGKWQKAMIACKEAIDICQIAGFKLYHYNQSGMYKLTDTINTQMSLRNAFNLRWNSEIVWGNTQSVCRGGGFNDGQLQAYCAPVLETIANMVGSVKSVIRVNLKMCRLFYTDNGIPLEEDNTRYVDSLYNLRVAHEKEQLYVRRGSTTVDLHFDREPRFYAWIGFDGGIWYGAGRYDDREPLFSVATKLGERDQINGSTSTNIFAKKIPPFDNRVTQSEYLSTPYPWPLVRLSDLYLLYAEAINEAEGPNGTHSADLFEYINLVRERAGLKGVKESWGGPYSKNRTKFNSPEGMRDIIQRERTIELMFEGQRFWDMRRWKTAPFEMNAPVEGWNGKESQARAFYTPISHYDQKFGIRDYFWPISNGAILNNPNLVQNIGW